MNWGDINMENIIIENGKKYSISIDIPEVNEIQNIIKRLESLENDMESMKNLLKKDEGSQTRIQELENQLEKYKKENVRLNENLAEIQRQAQEYRFKFEEIMREKYKIVEERDFLKVSNNRLNEQLGNLDILFKPCEKIIELLIQNLSLKDLRESLKIHFQNTLENRFKILYTLENSDKFLNEVASYYSKRLEPIEEIDKVFIKEINEFYGKDMLFLPKIDDEFDIGKMYDIEIADKRFKKIKEVYSPGIIGENGMKVKAKVKGLNE